MLDVEGKYRANFSKNKVLQKKFQQKNEIKFIMKEYLSVKERLIAFISYLGIGQGKFEKNCGLANAYVANIRKSITPEKLQQIAQRYPELNTGWLMTGEGDMLKGNISQTSHGDNSPNIAGNGNNINNLPTLDKALNEISEMRKLLEKSIQNNKEQADRFFTIIETMRGF